MGKTVDSFSVLATFALLPLWMIFAIIKEETGRRSK